MKDYTNQYDALIFDCDGTLTDSMPLHYVAWRDTMARHGIEFAEDRFYGMGGMPSEKIVATLSAEQDVSVDASHVAVTKEAAFVGMIDQLGMKEDIVAIARHHHGRMPMSVASGGTRPVIDRQLKQIGLEGIFDVIVTAEDTQRHKPEPDVFLKAAELLKVDPTRCLVFEDSPLGFAAAEAAGMDWVDVR
ncbi:HAD family hydrolase [Crateriforma conspicua]|uniref:Fructose-1-phosphate phosphatase YqaB n=1 Tax=Crateriforma conspicua TaxID=2527996 RepID=A0A5C5Y5Q1_9PLAN|nr:HAD-IA family hydrolase [Crateriforma conspicua]QDV65666.1 Fructose-1-phosphate phosphatase YqaB [Crateriforma conspicua]TWT71066.1 Fructose-1-phosphate phosphatase YqaB [Crateriforma conspicua]